VFRLSGREIRRLAHHPPVGRRLVERPCRARR